MMTIKPDPDGFSKGQRCNFCRTNKDDILYGQVYKIKRRNICVHYFCLLMASHIEQNGRDDQGLLGFFPKDILKEIDRCKNIKCCFCEGEGAAVNCCKEGCTKVFHLPCGVIKGSVHQFFGQFNSYCPSHRPMQQIPKKLLMKASKECAICTFQLPKDSYSIIWPTCCKPTSFFHRKCVQRMADNAGYYFKCPFCNNRQEFLDEMKKCGIYVPEQEASWESEPHAYEELLTAPAVCTAVPGCLCPKGREYNKPNTSWQVESCKLCGGNGIHIQCSGTSWKRGQMHFNWYCRVCRPTFKSNCSTEVNNTMPSSVESSTSSLSVLDQPLPGPSFCSKLPSVIDESSSFSAKSSELPLSEPTGDDDNCEVNSESSAISSESKWSNKEQSSAVDSNMPAPLATKRRRTISVSNSAGDQPDNYEVPLTRSRVSSKTKSNSEVSSNPEIFTAKGRTLRSRVQKNGIVENNEELSRQRTGETNNPESSVRISKENKIGGTSLAETPIKTSLSFVNTFSPNNLYFSGGLNSQPSFYQITRPPPVKPPPVNPNINVIVVSDDDIDDNDEDDNENSHDEDSNSKCEIDKSGYDSINNNCNRIGGGQTALGKEGIKASESGRDSVGAHQYFSTTSTPYSHATVVGQSYLAGVNSNRLISPSNNCQKRINPSANSPEIPLKRKRIVNSPADPLSTERLDGNLQPILDLPQMSEVSISVVRHSPNHNSTIPMNQQAPDIQLSKVPQGRISVSDSAAGFPVLCNQNNALQLMTSPLSSAEPKQFLCQVNPKSFPGIWSTSPCTLSLNLTKEQVIAHKVQDSQSPQGHRINNLMQVNLQKNANIITSNNSVLLVSGFPNRNQLSKTATEKNNHQDNTRSATISGPVIQLSDDDDDDVMGRLPVPPPRSYRRAAHTANSSSEAVTSEVSLLSDDEEEPLKESQHPVIEDVEGEGVLWEVCTNSGLIQRHRNIVYEIEENPVICLDSDDENNCENDNRSLNYQKSLDTSTPAEINQNFISNDNNINAGCADDKDDSDSDSVVFVNEEICSLQIMKANNEMDSNLIIPDRIIVPVGETTPSTVQEIVQQSDILSVEQNLVDIDHFCVSNENPANVDHNYSISSSPSEIESNNFKACVEKTDDFQFDLTTPNMVAIGNSDKSITSTVASEECVDTTIRTEENKCDEKNVDCNVSQEVTNNSSVDSFPLIKACTNMVKSNNTEDNGLILLKNNQLNCKGKASDESSKKLSIAKRDETELNYSTSTKVENHILDEVTETSKEAVFKEVRNQKIMESCGSVDSPNVADDNNFCMDEMPNCKSVDSLSSKNPSTEVDNNTLHELSSSSGILKENSETFSSLPVKQMEVPVSSHKNSSGDEKQDMDNLGSDGSREKTMLDCSRISSGDLNQDSILSTQSSSLNGLIHLEETSYNNPGLLATNDNKELPSSQVGIGNALPLVLDRIESDQSESTCNVNINSSSVNSSKPTFKTHAEYTSDNEISGSVANLLDIKVSGSCSGLDAISCLEAKALYTSSECTVDIEHQEASVSLLDGAFKSSENVKSFDLASKIGKGNIGSPKSQIKNIGDNCTLMKIANIDSSEKRENLVDLEGVSRKIVEGNSNSPSSEKSNNANKDRTINSCIGNINGGTNEPSTGKGKDLKFSMDNSQKTIDKASDLDYEISIGKIAHCSKETNVTLTDEKKSSQISVEVDCQQKESFKDNSSLNNLYKHTEKDDEEVLIPQLTEQDIKLDVPEKNITSQSIKQYFPHVTTWNLLLKNICRVTPKHHNMSKWLMSTVGIERFKRHSSLLRECLSSNSGKLILLHDDFCFTMAQWFLFCLPKGVTAYSSKLCIRSLEQGLAMVLSLSKSGGLPSQNKWTFTLLAVPNQSPASVIDLLLKINCLLPKTISVILSTIPQSQGTNSSGKSYCNYNLKLLDLSNRINMRIIDFNKIFTERGKL